MGLTVRQVVGDAILNAGRQEGEMQGRGRDQHHASPQQQSEPCVPPHRQLAPTIALFVAASGLALIDDSAPPARLFADADDDRMVFTSKS